MWKKTYMAPDVSIPLMTTVRTVTATMTPRQTFKDGMEYFLKEQKNNQKINANTGDVLNHRVKENRSKKHCKHCDILNIWSILKLTKNAFARHFFSKQDKQYWLACELSLFTKVQLLMIRASTNKTIFTIPTRELSLFSNVWLSTIRGATTKT